MTTKRPQDNPARELYEHRHDPDEWGEEPVELNVRPSKTAVISCRMPRKELDALEEAAAAAKETISVYVRKAVIMRRGGKAAPIGASVSYSLGNVFIQVDYQSAWNYTPAAANVENDYPQAVTAL